MSALNTYDKLLIPSLAASLSTTWLCNEESITKEKQLDMQINIYNKFYDSYFTSNEFKETLSSMNLLQDRKNFFVGNGVNFICSHMMEDLLRSEIPNSFSILL